MTSPYEVCVGKRKVFYPPASPKMLKSSDFHELALKPSIACWWILKIHTIRKCSPDSITLSILYWKAYVHVVVAIVVTVATTTVAITDLVMILILKRAPLWETTQ
jgi:hypothetical protein